MTRFYINFWEFQSTYRSLVRATTTPKILDFSGEVILTLEITGIRMCA